MQQGLGGSKSPTQQGLGGGKSQNGSGRDLGVISSLNAVNNAANLVNPDTTAETVTTNVANQFGVVGQLVKASSEGNLEKQANQEVNEAVKQVAVTAVKAIGKGVTQGTQGAVTELLKDEQTRNIIIAVVAMLILMIMALVGGVGNSDTDSVEQAGYYNNYCERNFAEPTTQKKVETYASQEVLNLNNAYERIGNYLTGTSNGSLDAEIESKIKKLESLLADVENKMVVGHNESYDVFEEKFIKYFLDEKSEEELKNEIALELEKNNKILLEDYYENFKELIDINYKLEMNEIKNSFQEENNKKSEEEESWNELREKIITEFENRKAGYNLVDLYCYQKVVPASEIEINKNIVQSDNAALASWEELQEMVSFLYFITNSDAWETASLSIGDDELKNILASLSDDISTVSARLNWYDSDGKENAMEFIYGSESQSTSLLVELRFLKDHMANYDDYLSEIYLDNQTSHEDYRDNTIVFNLKKIRDLIQKNYKDDISTAFIQGQSKDSALPDLYGVVKMQIARLFGASNYPSMIFDNETKRLILTEYSRVASNILPYMEDLDLSEFDQLIDRRKLTRDDNDIINGLTYKTANEFIADIDRAIIIMKNNFMQKILDAREIYKQVISDIENSLENHDKINKLDEKNFVIYNDTNVEDIIPGSYFVLGDEVPHNFKTIEINAETYNFTQWLASSSFYEQYLLDKDSYGFNTDYDGFKELLVHRSQFFYPVVNCKWENNIASIGEAHASQVTPGLGGGLVTPKTDDQDSYKYNTVFRFRTGQPVYSIGSGTVDYLSNNEITIKCEPIENIGGMFDDNYSLYVLYKNILPVIKKSTKILRYPVPNENAEYENNIRASTEIGKAKENFTIECFLVKDGNNINLNPLLLIQDDDELPEVPYIDNRAPTPTPTPTPVPTPAPTPVPGTFEPIVQPSPIPVILHPGLLLACATIGYYMGMLYAIWSLIKFALGIHNAESPNYQAIWEFIAAGVLIVGATIVKHILGY